MKSIPRTLLMMLAAGLTLQCRESGTSNPVAPPLRQLIIDQLVATPNRVFSGGGEARITGRVVDQESDPYPDLPVSFSARHGNITTTDTTDNDGGFEARYSAGDTSGVDTILIAAGDATAELFITILSPAPDLTLVLSTTSILANGVDTALVTATYVGRQGTLDRIPISFATSEGSFSGRRQTLATTDFDGRAMVVLTAPSSGRTLTATITASTQDTTQQASPGGRGRRKTVKDGLGRRTASEAAEVSLTITFRGVGIRIEARPMLIPGDGQSTAEIRAYVKEENLQAVSSARIAFAAQLGSIPVSALTDAAGVARVSLTSAPNPGDTDRVFARYGPQLADSVEVAYAPAVSRLTLVADFPDFRADGLSGATITAYVFGGTGQVAPGVVVTFNTDAGSLFPDSAVTNDQGIATTRLTGPAGLSDLRITVRGDIAVTDSSLSGKGSSSEIVVTRRRTRPQLREVITAASALQVPPAGSASTALPKTALILRPSLSAQVSVIARGLQIHLDASPASVIAREGSTSIITARVFETTSRNPVAGDTVRFAVTRGSIPGSARLDPDGIARVTFSAGDSTGQALVTARYGVAHRDSAIISLLPIIGSLTLESDRVTLLAGGIDSARITARVLDSLGAPAPGVTVQFSADSHPGEITSAATDDSGRAQWVVGSPAVESDSIVRLIARAGAKTDSLLLTVRAVARLISVNPDSISAGSRTLVAVTFQAFEKTAGRPVAADTVWFSAFRGVIQPFAILDLQGIARTIFLVGAEPGEAWVAGQLGELPPDTAGLQVVEPVAVVTAAVARGSILANGEDTTAVLVRVTNILGQPAPDAWLRLSSVGGSVAPERARTDSNGVARAVFRAAADNLDRNAEIIVSAEAAAFAAGQAGEIDKPQAFRPVPLRRLRGVPPDSGSGDILVADNINNEEDRNVAAPRLADSVGAVVTIELRGVNLAVRASPATIRADGRSRTGVNVQLSETTSGAAIRAARIGLGASLGAIAAEGVTGNDGRLTDSLTTGLAPGISVVRAIYGNQMVAVTAVNFTPDPARQNLIFQPDTLEAAAGSGRRIALRTRVVDDEGATSAGVGVTFALEGALWVLIDTAVAVEVVRYENVFHSAAREDIASLRLLLQLRGALSDRARIFLNRTPLDGVTLPQGDLWGEYALSLPSDRLQNGVNQIEIVSLEQNGVTDRFSVAGVRLGLVGSHTIGEDSTGEDGWAQVTWPVDSVAGSVLFRAALSDAPERFVQRSVRLTPGAPAGLRLATAADTLLANGSEESPLLALVTDAIGNPVAGGYPVRFAATLGRAAPAVTQTLGDGTALSLYTAPASDDDSLADLTATSEEAQGSFRLLTRGARLSLRLPDVRMLADGTSQMAVYARLSTAGGAAVGGRRIDFQVSRGAITPSAQTAADGVATATLTAADVADTALITATFGEAVRDSATVIYTPFIDQIALTSDPASLRADGLDSALVTVAVTDGLGNAAPGVRIDLDRDRGRLSMRRLVTGADGTASAWLFGVPSVGDDSLRIIASTTGGAHGDTTYVRLRGVTITLQTDPDSLAANGVAMAQITARVVETSSGNPVPSGRVSFRTNLGTIPAAAAISENGAAITTFTAAMSPGVATITGAFGDVLEAAGRVTLVDPVAALTLSVEPRFILANGTQGATLLARVTDPWGQGAPRELVTFSFNGPGTVTPDSGYTDARGEFFATARGRASPADSSLIVTAGVRDGAFSDTSAIELRGVNFSVQAEPTLIAGDGRETATITARVRLTTTGHPVANDTVRFTTSAGVIPVLARTDDQGEAAVALRSEAHPAIAEVIAAYGDRLADTVSVAFAGRFSYLALTLGRQSLLADGVDTTRATAVVLDTLWRPVAGVLLHFSVVDQIGELSVDTAVTTADGQASVVWRGAASVNDRTVRLQAAAGNLIDTVEALLRGVTLTISASPDRLPANGRALAVVAASLSETTHHTPLSGRVVYFSAERGWIGDAAETDSGGIARVMFTAPNDIGDVGVSALFGETLTAALTIPCVASEPERVTLLTDPDEVSVAGVGRVETATVSAVVRDAADNLVPDSSDLSFSVLGGLGVLFENGFDTISARTAEGVIRLTVHSGQTPGIVRFQALRQGRLLATGGDLAVRSGPPEWIRVIPALDSIYSPAGGISAFRVSSVVSDRFSNPVEDSTAVFFTLTPDSIATITAIGYTEGGVVVTPIDYLNPLVGVWLTYVNDMRGEVVWIHASAGNDVADSARVELP